MAEDVPAATDRRRVLDAGRPLPLWKVSALLTAAVSAFSMLWARGALVLDGAGNSLYVRIARDYLLELHRVPYWVPEMWAGMPVWALGPSFPVLSVMPLSLVLGPDVAVKVTILGFQVAGGIGTYVLARSMWGSRTAPLVAGLVYALHPMIVAHGALAGAMGVLGVTAATPWLAWSLRLALRGDGPRYVVVAGLVGAFAVLQQAEYALGLILLCVPMAAVELSAARRGGTSLRVVAARGAAVMGVALGTAAHWLLPFVTLGKSFVLSPPELVESELTRGLANQVGREIGLFFHRPDAIEGVVSFNRLGLVVQSFYVGWVCLALTAVSIVLLARRKGDAHLTAILVASGLAVWLSTGAVPLASSGPALRGQWVPLAIAGGLAGLLLGGFVRRLELGHARLAGIVGAAVFVLMLAFTAPYVALQKVIPLLAEIRFPRFYMLAALGLALGAAYPLTVAEAWSRRQTRFPGAVVMRALGVAAMVAFLIDVYPVTSHYRMQAPDGNKAYAAVADTLSLTGATARVASSTADPLSITQVLRAGATESIGWPHPAAGRELWRVTNEPYAGPQGYREAALGLSATALVATERRSGSGGPDETVDAVDLARNPRSLPLVRAYEQAVVVADPDLAPLMAISLAYRNVGVVTDRGPASPRLAAMPTARVGEEMCGDGAAAKADMPPILGGEVALACAVDRWIGRLFAGTELFPIAAPGVGGRFVSGADGLRGVAVWLDRLPGRTELSLREVGADGRGLGPELARSQAVGLDEYGLTAFTFDPIAGSGGRTFAFSVTCPGCAAGSEPRMVTGVAERGRGDLVIGTSLREDRMAAFAPVHDRLPAATVPGTRVTAQRTGPGSWKVSAEGPNPALLVVAETWFPGWRAQVDGHDAPVLQADGAFLGVVIPAGRHEVTLSYRRPLSAVLGRLVTFATLAGLAWAWWRRRPSGGPGRRKLLSTARGGRARSAEAGTGPRAGRNSAPQPVKPEASPPDGDALEVGAPPVQAPREPGLQAGEKRPRPPVAGRKRPSRE